MSDHVKLKCPHCNSMLTVDTAAGVIVSHEPPVQKKDKIDFDKRLQQIESEKDRSADIMAEAMRKEKDKERLMEDRFKELFDETKKKDDGSKPIRDIDLD